MTDLRRIEIRNAMIDEVRNNSKYYQTDVAYDTFTVATYDFKHPLVFVVRESGTHLLGDLDSKPELNRVHAFDVLNHYHENNARYFQISESGMSQISHAEALLIAGTF